jgi:glucokinase
MKTEEVDIAKLIALAKKTKGPLLSIADIGASTVRYALISGFTHDTVIFFVKRTAKSVPQLTAALDDIGKALGPEICKRVVAASLAVPGPVSNGAAVLANYEAKDTQGRTVDVTALPAALFPRGHTFLLNDLEAAGFGIVGLNSVGDMGMFRVLWEPKQSPAAGHVALSKLPAANVLVVAPGTGLGSALLHYHDDKKQYSVLPLEFGHTTVPQHEHSDMLKAFKSELGYEVEYDDTCTGRGLEFAYRFHSGGQRKSAAEVSALSKAGDATAIKAMSTYHHQIMIFCSQLVMGFQPTLVVLTGDNVINNAHFFTSAAHVQDMRKHLLSHSMERMGFMSRSAVAVQVHRQNLNMVGCIYRAFRDAQRSEAPKAKL